MSDLISVAFATLLMGLPAVAGAQTVPPRPAHEVSITPVVALAQPTGPADDCGLRITGPQGMLVVPSAPTSAGQDTRCLWLIQAPGHEQVSLVFGAASGRDGGYDIVRLFAGDGEMLGTLRDVASGTSLQGLPRTLVLEIETGDPRLLNGLDVHIGASILEF